MCTMEFEHVNKINVEKLMTLHKEALAVTKNQTVLVNNILKDYKHTNLETLSIVRKQVNTVQKVLEIQDLALKIYHGKRHIPPSLYTLPKTFLYQKSLTGSSLSESTRIPVLFVRIMATVLESAQTSARAS